MNNINYRQILIVNYADKQWNMFGNTYDGIEWLDTSSKPSQVELELLWETTQDNIAKSLCSKTAKDLLTMSDWSVLPDVGLQNLTEFVSYREVLRGLVINPVVNPDFPAMPTPIWK